MTFSQKADDINAGTVHEKLSRILENQERILENQSEQQIQIELIRDRLESLDTFEELPIQDLDEEPFGRGW